jgi:hypothetical protein
MGVHFQVVAYKELATFPSEWEVWKTFLHNVISSQVWKNFLQVFKLKVCEKRVLQVVEGFNIEDLRNCAEESYLSC